MFIPVVVILLVIGLLAELLVELLVAADVSALAPNCILPGLTLSFYTRPDRIGPLSKPPESAALS